MKEISDAEIIKELEKRFDKNRKVLQEQKELVNQFQTLNRKLLESEKLKGEFLSNIRNEINNPLSSILGLSYDIRSGNIDMDQVHSNSKLIFEEAFNLDFQLKNIFFAAEIEAGEMAPYIMNVNLYSHISTIIDSFSHLIEKKNLNIHLKYQDSDDLHFKTDTEKLQLIMSNLLANAIEYGPEKSDINITIQLLENRRLGISVQDFGVGISDEDMEIIFDRFMQVDKGTTKLHRGHGLGLAITKSLVDMLDGKVLVEYGKETGTVFSIFLDEGKTPVGADEFSGDGNEFLFDETEVF